MNAPNRNMKRVFEKKMNMRRSDHETAPVVGAVFGGSVDSVFL